MLSIALRRQYLERLDHVPASGDWEGFNMGRFGNTVDSLLETYSKCLSLLKGLRGAENNSQPRQLRKCIRSDRSKVLRAYSSRLSLSGSHFEKGDGTQPPE